MHKTCLIFNPTAGGERGRKFIEELRREATGVTFAATVQAGDGETLAAQHAREGFTTLVAGGGDGTINEVINGLMSVNSGEGVRLGVLPFGTQNVFASELGISHKPREAWNVIEQGRTRRIDLPRVSCQRNGGSAQRFFVQLAGAGFDARAVEVVDLERKKFLGPLEYVIAGLRVAAEPAPQLRVEADGERLEGRFVIVGNGRFYGGPFALFPNAANDDGKLDVCVFQNGGYLDFLRYFQGILRGVHPDFDDVKLLSVERLRISSATRVPLEVDGEFLGVLPCAFDVVPRALDVIVP
jgi:diacylglycerol kinase (ATP)